nr:MAG TPA: hypothetical protein [Caudoviricetes sp.]
MPSGSPPFFIYKKRPISESLKQVSGLTTGASYFYAFSFLNYSLLT